MFGNHCWKAWSSTQGAVVLSSAEAEFYAMVEGTQRGKRAVTVATELGIQLGGGGLVLNTDSEAAKSFVSRRGLGECVTLNFENCGCRRRCAKVV